MTRNMDECRIWEEVWEEESIWEGTRSEQCGRALLYLGGLAGGVYSTAYQESTRKGKTNLTREFEGSRFT